MSDDLKKQLDIIYDRIGNKAKSNLLNAYWSKKDPNDSTYLVSISDIDRNVIASDSIDLVPNLDYENCFPLYEKMENLLDEVISKLK